MLLAQLVVPPDPAARRTREPQHAAALAQQQLLVGAVHHGLVPADVGGVAHVGGGQLAVATLRASNGASGGGGDAPARRRCAARGAALGGRPGGPTTTEAGRGGLQHGVRGAGRLLLEESTDGAGAPGCATAGRNGAGANVGLRCGDASGRQKKRASNSDVSGELGFCPLGSCCLPADAAHRCCWHAGGGQPAGSGVGPPQNVGRRAAADRAPPSGVCSCAALPTAWYCRGASLFKQSHVQ